MEQANEPETTGGAAPGWNNSETDSRRPQSTLRVAFTTAIITAVLTLLISWGSTYYTHYLNQADDLEAQRRRVVSELSSSRSLIRSLEFSRMQAQLHATYYSRLYGLVVTQNPKAVAMRHMGAEALIDSSQYENRRSHELINLKSEQFAKLHGTVALVQILFPDTPELRELCQRVVNMPGIELDIANVEDQELDALNAWREKAQAQARDRLESSYIKPIEELGDYLRKRLTK